MPVVAGTAGKPAANLAAMWLKALRARLYVPLPARCCCCIL
jgi:hypothetical protein